MNTRIFFLLFFLIFSSLFADNDLEKYLKPALNKSDIHKMRNIDFIYMINLDQRPQKFEKSMQQLNPYGIYPYRFSAVNGWELPLDTINNVGVKFEPWMNGGQMANYYVADAIGVAEDMLYKIAECEPMSVIGKTYFCHTMSVGAIGIVLSHLSILQDAYNSGYETIWVMEDDIQIIQNPHLLSYFIDSLDMTVGKGNWDVLFTDQNTKDRQGNYVSCCGYAWRPNFTPSDIRKFVEVIDISSEFRKIGARYGAYSMIVRRSGIKKILDFIKHYHIFLPYDMDYTQAPNIQLYSLTNDVISTIPLTFTDNAAPFYQFGK